MYLLVWTLFLPCISAVSTHFSYSVPQDGNVVGFQTQVTVTPGKDPSLTFFMAIGFDGGYFGMQVRSPTERWVIFSLWDTNDGQKARVVKKGPNAVEDNFGGEGTGKKTFLEYNWQTGVPQDFMLTLENSQVSGYFKINGKWQLISTLTRPQTMRGLTGLYSFVENWGKDHSLIRQGSFGRQVYQVEGSQTWTQVLEASTSYSNSTSPGESWSQYADGDHFVMEIDGYTGKTTKANTKLTRKASDAPLEAATSPPATQAPVIQKPTTQAPVIQKPVTQKPQSPPFATAHHHLHHLTTAFHGSVSPTRKSWMRFRRHL